MYWTSEISGTLTVVDAAAHAVLASIRLGDGEGKPVGIAVSPDGRRVYVANGLSGSISVVDVREARVVRSIPVGRLPWGVAIGR